MKKILVIGSINMDFQVEVNRFPKAGETVMSRGFRKLPGGKGANQAYACGRLGGNPVFAGAVGDDGVGDAVVKNLQAAGVKTRVQTIGRTPSGMAFISIDGNGDNSILVIPGANNSCDAAFVQQLEEEIKACDILLVQLEIPLEGAEKALELGKKHGKITILNPAPVPEKMLSEQIYKNLTYLTPNETELAKLTGMPTGSLEEVACAGQSFLKKGVENVLVTLGERGCMLIHSQYAKTFDSIKVKAIDTTGAGDTFHGALAVQLAEGKTIEEAIPFAVVAAGLSVTREGAQAGVPEREEVLRKLQE